MIIRKRGSWVLWYECVGFGVLLLLSCLNELGKLSWLFGGDHHGSGLRGAAVESVLILLIWGVVFHFTRRLVAHLHYLEGFLRVCAWCRKVGSNEGWMRLEEYFSKGFHIATTHGVCPDCMKKMEEDTKEFHRQRVLATPPAPPPEAAPQQNPSC